MDAYTPWFAYIPWFAWIAIVGIVVWGITVIVGTFGSGRGKKSDDLAKAIEENAATNRALLAKLEGIDHRLGAVEKTLNDIP